MKNLGIYVHVPFCVKKCNYCDFNSYSDIWEYEDAYFDALIGEIKKMSGADKYCVDTIYIGGGTPSAVCPENIIRVMSTIGEQFAIAESCEITIECNPATVDFDGFRRYRASGINRVSMGLQSANGEELLRLGRIHTLGDFENSFNDARRAGFTNISLDLMFGLPDQTPDKWQKTLSRAAEFGAEHISCYALTVEENTPFSKMKLNLPDDDTQREMYDLAVDFLEKHGYARYEISNFARRGCKSRHNLKYWRLDEYAGFGAGAHSFLNGKRLANEASVLKYISGAPPECTDESGEDLMSEFMFLGLRTSEGVAESDFSERFMRGVDSVFGDILKKYENVGAIARKNGRIFIKPEFLYVSNSILCDFVK